MVVNPNSFRPGLFVSAPETPKTPTFFDTLQASFGYSYDPVYEQIMNHNRFGSERIDGYDPYKDMEGYEMFATHLRGAVSPDHMASLKRGLNESMQRREVLANSSFLSQLGAGIFDPINLIALPFGGPAFGVGRSALRVGAGAATLQAGIETTLIQPFDPLQTGAESAANVAGAFIFGGALGGAASVPLTRRARAYAQVEAQLKEYHLAVSKIEHISELTSDDLVNISNPTNRPHSDLQQPEVEAKIQELTAKRDKLLQASNSLEAGKLDPYANELEDISLALSGYRREAGIRNLQAAGYDSEKLWSIADNIYTDSVFYKAVTTPFKRILQSKYSTGSMKEATVRLAGDSGVNYVANVLGISSPLSVAQRAVARNGQWVKAHDDLISIFRDDMGLVNTSKLDVDPVLVYRSIFNKDNSYKAWLKGINKKRTTKEQNLSDVDRRAIKVLDDFFEKAEVELADVGLIGTKKNMTDKLRKIERDIISTQQIIDGLKKPTKKTARRKENAVRRLGYLQKEKLKTEAQLKNFDDTKQSNDLNDKFLPRFWDINAIKKDRAKIEKIIADWYAQNPRIWEFDGAKWVAKDLPSDATSVSKRAKKTVDNILNESDPTNESVIHYGYGRSKHFRHRQIDIPNRLVWDFIEQDPIAIMKTYTARIAPRLEFRKQFGGDLVDVEFRLEDEMLRRGMSEKQINKDMRDFKILYDRIAGAVLRNPTAASQRTAYMMKELATLNYLGSAGAAAIPEFGRIIMEHDGQTMIKALQATLDNEVRTLSAKEVRLSGEAIDIVKGAAHMRMVDDMANNVDANEIWNQARQAFHVLNLLGPITQISKTLDGIARGHTIIDRSIKLSNGKATDFERTWLARYGIDEVKARDIARMPWQESKNGLYLANTEEWSEGIYVPEIEGRRIKIVETNEDGTPVGIERNGFYVPARYNYKTNTMFFDREYIEGKYFENKVWLNPRNEGITPMPDIFKTPKQWANFVMLHEIMHSRSRAKKGESFVDYENRINQMALKEYKAQAKTNQEALEVFRGALNSGILNTIMTATPADRPIVNDGIVFVPHRIAKAFGYAEDKTYKGYSRIENGFLALPFQFYSYTLANVNKMVGGMAHGQMKNRAIGLATMLGLGYLSVKMKTPDFAWEDMSWRDRFARSYDSAGITALYSDLFYTAMHTSLALGGPNITRGIINPKFPQEPNLKDALTNFAGAGPSIVADISSGALQFASGEYGEGGKQVFRNLPFARMWFWKDEMNAMTRAWGQ